MKERIKQIRKEAGLTQAKFAKELGVSTVTVGNYECGMRTPLSPIIRSIADKFGYNEQWILTGEGEPKKPELDEKAMYVSYLLDDDNPFNDMIINIMKIYNESDAEVKAVINEFIRKMRK